MKAPKAVRLTALQVMITRIRQEDPELWERIVEFAKKPPEDVYERFARSESMTR